MTKRTWRWVTRDLTNAGAGGTVCVWLGVKPPIINYGSWEESKPNKVFAVDGAEYIQYGHWLEVFGVPLKPGEIKKVRFTCEVL
jgi:hypothetical protein